MNMWRGHIMCGRAYMAGGGQAALGTPQCGVICMPAAACGGVKCGRGGHTMGGTTPRIRIIVIIIIACGFGASSGRAAPAEAAPA